MSSAARVWIFVIGVALAYDVLAIHKNMETLSEWCGKHPRVTLGISSYLLAHLMGRPRMLHGIDPLHLIANRIRSRLEGEQIVVTYTIE